MKNSEKKRLLKKSQLQLNAKLRFEKKISAGVRSFLRRQNAQVAEHFERFGVRLDASRNVEIARVMLEKHYSDVADTFYRDVVKEGNYALVDAGVDPVDRNNPIILASLASFISRESTDGAKRIVDRSNSDIEVAIGNGSRTPNQVYESLDSVTIRRSVALAHEHTQRAAEGAKDETATAVSRLTSASLFVASRELTNIKTWVDRMDRDVRDTHLFARFQTVQATMPFYVGGESLMYPGDMSLGASIENVANCRCNAIYSFDVV